MCRVDEQVAHVGYQMTESTEREREKQKERFIDSLVERN